MEELSSDVDTIRESMKAKEASSVSARDMTENF